MTQMEGGRERLQDSDTMMGSKSATPSQDCGGTVDGFLKVIFMVTKINY